MTNDIRDAAYREHCTLCGGDGRLADHPCGRCGGTGRRTRYAYDAESAVGAPTEQDLEVSRLRTELAAVTKQRDKWQALAKERMESIERLEGECEAGR